MTGRLAGKVTLVTEGTSSLGVEVVRSFLLEDATVIVPSQSFDEVKWLQEYISDIKTGKLITLLTDPLDYYKATDIVEDIKQQYQQIDLAVSIFAGIGPSPSLTDLELLDWEKAIGSSVTPFFVAGRIILHMMKEMQYGVFISVSDTEWLDRKPYASLAYIATLTQVEMARLFAEEVKHHHVRYHHLFTNNIVTREKSPGLIGKPGWLTPEMLGEHIINMLYEEMEDPQSMFQYYLGKPFRFFPPAFNERL